MKLIYFLILTLLFSGCATNQSNLPIGTIQKGSLSNQQLIHDAMVGVVGKVATLGCSKMDSYEPYVVAMPQGNVGSRYWMERWIVKGCSKEYPINIRFSESGLNEAVWSIE